jgi:pyruvate/2-oxoglutarate dehydrogenase complex dihydrolipoamide dehydrogenase (E3) component
MLIKLEVRWVTHNDAEKTNAERKKRRRPKQNKAEKTRPTELARMIIPVIGRRPNLKTVKSENGRIHPRNKAERVVFFESQ